MPLARHGRRHYPGKKAAMRKRAAARKAKKGARPMRSLPSTYKAVNIHRFVRETMPQTKSFHIVPAGSAFPAMGKLVFDSLSFNLLANGVTDFGNLFARYKIDKIETILTPLFGEVTETYGPNANYSLSPALRITRINTKYFNGPLDFGSTSDAVLSQLAQIQSKSVTPYASRRSLKMTTYNPGVYETAIEDNTNPPQEITVRAPGTWLNISTQNDVPFIHNSAIFAERTDGSDLTDAWKYRVVHKVYFRCSQVG